ncbi:MAG: PAS domain S-box protein [Candidatus Hydrogenedentes bacterium]|nr:PAS domain S-box protein [Candidatus Hydrogenedentota bacterium]
MSHAAYGAEPGEVLGADLRGLEWWQVIVAAFMGGAVAYLLGRRWLWKPESTASQTLRESENKFHALADLSAAAIFIHRGQKFCYMNRAATIISGFSTEELLNMNFWDLVVPEWRELARERGLARLRGEETRERYELAIRCKDGGDRWIALTNQVIDYEGKAAVLGTFQDITEHRSTEEALRQRNEELEALNRRLRKVIDASKRMAVSSSVEELGRIAMDQFADMVGAEGGCLFIKRGDALVRVYSLDGDHVPAQIPLPLREHSVFGRVWETKTSILIEDIKARTDIDRSGWDGYFEQSVLSLPLLSDQGDVSGIIALHNKKLAPFTVQDRDLAMILGSLCCETMKSMEASAAMKTSESKYRDLVESANTIILRMNTKGEVTFINEYAQSFFGYSENEIIGQNVVGTIVPDHDRAGRDLAAMVADIVRYPDRYNPNENENMRRNGERVWVSWSNKPLQRPDGSFSELLCVGTDVTQRRLSEQLLRESEERYRSFFENTSEGIYRYETKKPIPISASVDEQFDLIMENVYLAECNDAMARMHGLSRAEEFIGVSLKQFSAEDPRNIKYVREFIQAGYRLDDFPTIITDAKGNAHHFINSLVGFVEDGYVVRAWGVQRDITDRIRNAEALRERDEMIRSLVETSRDWIWTVDVNGVHTFSNPAVESILGYKPEEIVGRSGTDLTHEEDRAIFEDQFPRWVAERRGWRNIMVRWKHKEGAWRFLESTAVPIVDSDGNLTGFRGVDRDVTDRRQLQEQLLQSQKMEAVGQLAGGIAHDFNNLLQAILGYTDLILEDLAPGDNHRSELEQVRLAAERASTLTRQLLTFSRRQVIQPVPVDLNELVAGLMKMLRRIIGEHIQLDIIPGHRLGTVHADVSQIEQVLLNLCVNARDAMPDGGRLTIETENVVVDHEFKVNHPWAKEGRYVLLSVTDTGCGMEKTVLEHVFEPFFTTKGEGEGTGLGLATVYGIVKHHDGMIHTYSEVGKGTTFKVYLPISQRAAVTIGDKVTGMAPGGTETILLAEDEEMILNLAARLLRDAGYTVLTASDGIEAMYMFDAHADAIDLALLDVVMPRMGGREVQKRIREKKPHVKFLFASGYSANAIHTNFVLAEDLQLIQKPYQRDALLRKVREVLDSA